VLLSDRSRRQRTVVGREKRSGRREVELVERSRVDVSGVEDLVWVRRAS
jgi:hypothetical protein